MMESPWSWGAVVGAAPCLPPHRPSRPSLRGEGGREVPVSQFCASPTSRLGVLVCDFDLLPLSLQLSSLLLPHCGGWAVSPMTLCV